MYNLTLLNNKTFCPIILLSNTRNFLEESISSFKIILSFELDLIGLNRWLKGELKISLTLD